MTPFLDAWNGMCPCLSHWDMAVTFTLGAIVSYVLTSVAGKVRHA